MLCDHGIQAGDVSQCPGFFFVNLCHVVTDDLDLHTDRMRFRWRDEADWTYSFLDTIRLEGSKPDGASCESTTRIKVQGCITRLTSLKANGIKKGVSPINLNTPHGSDPVRS